MSQLLHIAACIAVPILWGAAVHWLFERVLHRKPAPALEEVASDGESAS